MSNCLNFSVRILLCTFLNTFLVAQIFGQNSKIDSLQKVLLTQTAEDTSRFNTLYTLPFEYYDIGDFKKYREYLDKSYSLAVKINYRLGIAKCLFTYGWIEENKGDYKKALGFYGRALEITKELEDKRFFARYANKVGIIHETIGNYQEALDHYEKSLSEYEKLKDTLGMGHAFNNMGLVNYNLGNYARALENFLTAEKIYKRAGDNESICLVLNNIGLVYSRVSEVSTSMIYYQQSLKIALENRFDYHAANAYHNIGNCYLSLENPNHYKALEAFFTAKELYKKVNDKPGLVTAIGNIGRAYSGKGDMKKAMEHYVEALKIGEEIGAKREITFSCYDIAECHKSLKEYEKALEYTEKGLAIAKELNSLDLISEGYNFLSEVYNDMHDYKKSLEYFKLYKNTNDSIFSKENFKTIAELQTRYETEKKEKEIELLTKENQLKEKESREQKIIRSSLMGGLILLFILSFVLYNRYRLKQKSNQELQRQKKVIEHQNSQIVESINYSKQIQEALLPSKIVMEKSLHNLFVFYSPKDIVSGDFYWFKAFEKYSVLACVDCTGHGVPGGFMSTLGSLLMDKVVHESLPSSEILSRLSGEIIKVLHQQDGGAIQDGMDLSVCLIDHANKTIEFSGARNGIIVVTNGRAKKYKADLYPVGGNYMKKGKAIDRRFSTQKIAVDKNDWIYMYTDGFMEQIGGENALPMNYTQFENHLVTVSDKPGSEEKITALQSQLDNWRGTHDRNDDVLIIGFQIL